MFCSCFKRSEKGCTTRGLLISVMSLVKPDCGDTRWYVSWQVVVIQYPRFQPSFPADRMFDEYSIIQRTGEELFCSFVGRDNGFEWCWRVSLFKCPRCNDVNNRLAHKAPLLTCPWLMKEVGILWISTEKNVREPSFQRPNSTGTMVYYI